MIIEWHTHVYPPEEAAADALAVLGPGAQVAVPELIVLLGDPHAREAAINALGKIGPPAVTPLIARLEIARDEERVHVCRALAAIGPAATRAFRI